MQPFRLLRFRNRIELELLLSLFVNRLRTVLAVKGPLRRAETARPRPLRAVLKKPFLIRGKGELGNLMTRHLNISPLHRRDHARATTPRGTCTAAEGLDAETFRGFQLAGELFLLTSFFK